MNDAGAAASCSIPSSQSDGRQSAVKQRKSPLDGGQAQPQSSGLWLGAGSRSGCGRTVCVDFQNQCVRPSAHRQCQLSRRFAESDAVTNGVFHQHLPHQCRKPCCPGFWIEGSVETQSITEPYLIDGQVSGSESANIVERPAAC